MNTSFLKQLSIKNINHSIFSGIESKAGNGEKINSTSPVNAAIIGATLLAKPSEYKNLVKDAQIAFKIWKNIPAPKRGEIVRQIGMAFRENKQPLGQLVSYEMGKSLQEGLGEVQEMIDICDFAVGLSRQLYGSTMHSERPSHRMYDQYHPLGIVGIISAFNFPVAVWAWNAMIAMVCGNVSIWKPSEKTPLSAIACFHIIKKVLITNKVPKGCLNCIIGNASIGELISQDPAIALVSATGSTKMGKKVATAVAARLGKSLLELGGNNAIILSKQADIALVIPAVVFGAIGTAGQRCTSTRRLLVQKSIFTSVIEQLKKGYNQVKVGNPLDPQFHMGPLIDQDAVKQYMHALHIAKKQGGKVLFGGTILKGKSFSSQCYVTPALVKMKTQTSIVFEETFAPILYVIPFSTITEAIQLQNQVPQGLSSALFTTNLNEAEYFLSVNGSDCGIANINIGTSGAEIGGAFGGEKETGGGRESGSDAWKAYMRRQTNTINFSDQMPLAQGIQFNF